MSGSYCYGFHGCASAAVADTACCFELTSSSASTCVGQSRSFKHARSRWIMQHQACQQQQHDQMVQRGVALCACRAADPGANSSSCWRSCEVHPALQRLHERLGPNCEWLAAWLYACSSASTCWSPAAAATMFSDTYHKSHDAEYLTRSYATCSKQVLGIQRLQRQHHAVHQGAADRRVALTVSS